MSKDVPTCQRLICLFGESEKFNMAGTHRKAIMLEHGVKVKIVCENKTN